MGQTLVADFEKMGYVRNPYDKCIFTLSSGTKDKAENQGIVLVEADDILEGGNAVHRKNMEQFFSKYKCGKRKNLLELGSEGSLISGIRVRQNKDYSFTWHMVGYAYKMKIIEAPRGFDAW